MRTPYWGPWLLLVWAAVAQADAVKLSPSSIDFGIEQIHTNSEIRSLVVISNTRAGLHVTVDVTKPTFLVDRTSFDLLPDKQQTILVHVNSQNSPLGTFSGAVTLRFSALPGERIPLLQRRELDNPKTVPLKVVIGDFTPVTLGSPLDFGTMGVGQTKQLSFQIKNPAPEGVTCKPFLLDKIVPLGFVVPSTLSIPANGQVSVPVGLQGLQAVACSGGDISQFAGFNCGPTGNSEPLFKAKIQDGTRLRLSFQTAQPSQVEVRVEDSQDPCANPVPVVRGGCSPLTTPAGCQDAHIRSGHTVTLRFIQPAGKFLQYRGTGSASVCDKLPTCSFSMTTESSVAVDISP
jgi:hypothetical protein